MDALFEADGDGVIPTELARGPWDPGALHGGPTAALVTWAVERHLGEEAGTGPAWEMARLTLELLRPVPLERLAVTTRTSRPGRKVTLVEADVTPAGGGRAVARATVLSLRRRPLELPTPTGGHGVTSLPEALQQPEPPDGAGMWKGFHNGAVEMRSASGVWGRTGPATIWMRLLVPVVAGEETSPAMRAAALADFGNGISSELDFRAWRFLNPELTVHLARPPEGEWIELDARTVVGTFGAGVAQSVLSDHTGQFGVGTQALLIERG